MPRLDLTESDERMGAADGRYDSYGYNSSYSAASILREGSDLLRDDPYARQGAGQASFGRPTSRGLSVWEGSAAREAYPQREQVSAHLGESTVVSVTPRGARSGGYRHTMGVSSSALASAPAARTTGFTLVPELSERDMGYQRPSRDYDRDRSSGRERQRERDRSLDLDRLRERGSLYTGDREVRPAGVGDFFRGLLDSLAALPGAAATTLLGAIGHMRVGGLLVVASIALAIFMLYSPIRDVYVANRRLDYLQDTYDILLDENAELRSELEMLQTREGIENEARARGFVEEGETKVVVDGLPDEDEINVNSLITEKEPDDNRTWVTRTLDKLFGYEPGE